MAAKRTVLGLDIGRHAVRLVWAEMRGGKPRVTRTESLRLPPATADTKGVILPWLEQHKVAGSACVIGIQGFQSMFQPFVLAPGDPRSLEDAAAMETVKFNDMASETMTYGFTPVSLNEGEKRLLLAMARPTILNQILAWGTDAGLRIMDIVPTPIAMCKSIETTIQEEDGPVLVVGIGHSSTDVAVYSRSAGLMFARAFPSGGQLFTDRVARTRGVPGPAAEKLKIDKGSILPDTELAEPLKQVADAWIGEVDACLGVYRSLYTGRSGELQKLIVTGGGSQLHGLATYAGARMELAVEAASETIEGHAGIEGIADFSVAAGLAFCGLGHGDEHISLLPQGVRDELTFKRQKPFWIAACVMAALIFGASLAGGFRDYRRQADRLSKDKASLRRRQELVTQIERLRFRNRQIRAASAPLRTLMGASPVMRDLISVIAEQKSPRDRITMICDADCYFFETEWDEEKATKLGIREQRERAKRAEERVASKGIERVIVEGFTRDVGLSRVKDLIQVLRSKPFVTSADLLSDDELVGETAEWSQMGRLFVIDVGINSLSPQPDAPPETDDL